MSIYPHDDETVITPAAVPAPGNAQPEWLHGSAEEQRAQRAAGSAQRSNARVDRSSWPKADHDGMAIASLITAFFIPILAVIFGWIHINEAHKKNQRASSVAAWGLGLGIAGCIGWTLYWLIAIILIVAAAHGASAGYSG